jgi:uncharacterized protein YkwD
MSRYVQIQHWSGVALLQTALLSGCAWGPTWPDRAGAHATTTRAVSSSEMHDFDPKTACAEIVKAHNRKRAAAKLPALAISLKLEDAARRHAKDMAAQGKMTHKGSDGSSAIERIKAAGYQYRRAGENIAAGHFTIDGLMKGWMDSPPHRRNILGSFSQIGAAYATAENGKRYWCVTFGLPARR